MIDIHNHSLPGMDDGAKDIEMSISMLKESANQGVQEIILTPHMNHPLDFEPVDHTVEEKVSQLQQQLDKKGIPLRLYSGAECYIQKHQLNAISQLPIKTLNNTDYVLVEFERSIHFREMDHGLHELKLMGFKPILAHVEVYQCLRKNIDRIEQLRDQGYVIQCNASYLVSKEKNSRSQFVTELVQLGLVDVLASDNHNMSSRPQLLGEAKRWFEKRRMQQEAIRILESNPKAIINNKPITKGAIKKSSRKGWHVPAAVSLVAVLILGSVVVYSMTGGKEPISDGNNQQQEELAQEANAQKGTEQDTDAYKDITQEDGTQGIGQGDEPASDRDSMSDQADIDKADGIGDNSEKASTSKDDEAERTSQEDVSNQSQEHGESDELTDHAKAEALVQDYISYFETLEDDYMQEVDSYMTKFRGLADLDDVDEQEQLANTYLDQLGNAENESDNRVYKALYDMQNDLEALSYPTDIVEDIRARYLETKNQVSKEHEQLLRTWYNKVRETEG